MPASPSRRLFSAAVAVALALAPLVAEARPGGGGSMGSRGTRTYNSAPAHSAPAGQPIQRSVTPPPSAPAQPQAPARAPYGQPGYAQPGYGYGQPGFGQRHPFLTGLAGGLLGASLGHMLFGGSAADYAMGGGAGALGTLLRFLLLAGLAWGAWSLFRRVMAGPRAAVPGGYGQPASYDGGYAPVSQGGGFDAPAPAGGPSAVPAGPAVAIAMGEGDLQAFERILSGVMAAWSRADIAGLRRLVTPEMLSYLSEELTGNQSQGVHNRVEDVVLVKGDVVESWDENGATYCTAVLRWTARDWTVSEADGRVVSGDPTHPAETGEAWTFVRVGGGSWLLSAIQQL
jgi:predicted lipid-binding transport protein (Tim44 family)